MTRTGLFPDEPGDDFLTVIPDNAFRPNMIVIQVVIVPDQFIKLTAGKGRQGL